MEPEARLPKVPNCGDQTDGRGCIKWYGGGG